MADIKLGEPFGLDPAAIKAIDWPLALKRVSHDLRSDFIYAPHLAFIYSKAGDALITQVTAELKSGAYSPGVPITIEVPKSFRMRVAVAPIRLGPASLGLVAFCCRVIACFIKRWLTEPPRLSRRRRMAHDRLVINWQHPTALACSFRPGTAGTISRRHCQSIPSQNLPGISCEWTLPISSLR